MSYTVVNLVDQKRIRPVARASVLRAMAHRVDADGHGVWESVPNLAKRACVCDRTVQRHLAGLLSDGLIEEVGRVACQYGATNNYRLRLDAIRALPDKFPSKARHGGASAKSPVTTSHPTGDSLSPKPVTEPVTSDLESHVSKSESPSQSLNRPVRSRRPNSHVNAEAAARFDQLVAMWPARRHGDIKRARSIFMAAVRRGGDPSNVLAASKRYLTQPGRLKDDGLYCRKLENFLGKDLASELDASDGERVVHVFSEHDPEARRHPARWNPDWGQWVVRARDLGSSNGLVPQ